MSNNDKAEIVPLVGFCEDECDTGDLHWRTVQPDGFISMVYLGPSPDTDDMGMVEMTITSANGRRVIVLSDQQCSDLIAALQVCVEMGRKMMERLGD